MGQSGVISIIARTEFVSLVLSDLDFEDMQFNGVKEEMSFVKLVLEFQTLNAKYRKQFTRISSIKFLKSLKDFMI